MVTSLIALAPSIVKLVELAVGNGNGNLKKVTSVEIMKHAAKATKEVGRITEEPTVVQIADVVESSVQTLNESGLLNGHYTSGHVDHETDEVLHVAHTAPITEQRIVFEGVMRYVPDSE